MMKNTVCTDNKSVLTADFSSKAVFMCFRNICKGLETKYIIMLKYVSIGRTTIRLLVLYTPSGKKYRAHNVIQFNLIHALLKRLREDLTIHNCHSQVMKRSQCIYSCVNM